MLRHTTIAEIMRTFTFLKYLCHRLWPYFKSGNTEKMIMRGFKDKQPQNIKVFENKHSHLIFREHRLWVFIMGS